MSSVHKNLTFCHFVLCMCVISQYISTARTFELTEAMKNQAKKIHDYCQKQTGVSEDIIHQGHDGNIPNDPVLKCYFHCLFDTVGLIDSNNVVHLESLKDLLPMEVHDVIQNLADKCGTQPGVDGCDTVYETLKCYFVADKNSLMKVASFLHN